jgi:beta-galactosidase
MHSRWPRLDGLAYGGEYNPEQWPEEVWEQDVALMREAGVTLVSVGIFSWGMLEPRPGEYEFGWLDRVLGLLHGAGIAVDLGTPTAAPPPWFLHRHPRACPVTRDGLILGGGSRQAYCPSSPAYAAAAAGITRQLAQRYGAHPAVVLWHVNNEYGAPLGECYCETSAASFRAWLRDRYGDLDTLNDHWGAAFWSHRYGDWDEIDAPRTSTTAVNPAQRLDFARFSSDALLDCFRRERNILHELSPGIPVTTNFMATNCKSIDYWRWAPEVDVISNDNYLTAEDPEGHVGLAMSADLTRSLAGGGPWLLMEHSTSAVSWQPRNIAKRPGEMRRNSLAHVARGADGVLFFQWRASRFGAEKHHSAMLPQGGTGTRVWREVVGLGAEVASLATLRGTVVEPDIALLWDWESWWAQELEWRPSVDLGYLERVRAWYEASLRAGLTADFAHPGADLSRYRLVIAPALYLTTERAAANLRRYVEGGGTLVVSCFSGIVDDRDRVYPGPYPGALRDVLGLIVEEWLPLRAGERVTLGWEEPGIFPDVTGPGLSAAPAVISRPSAVMAAVPVARAAAPGPAAASVGTAVAADSVRSVGPAPVSEPLGSADAWTEAVILAGAKPVAWYTNGPAAGGPAVTRHDLGEGRAWYVSARTDAPATAAVLAAACDSAGLTPPARQAEPQALAEPPVIPGDPAAALGISAESPGPLAAPGGWPRDLELVRRTDGQRRFITLINHGDTPAAVQLPGRIVTVQAGDVQVITE